MENEAEQAFFRRIQSALESRIKPDLEQRQLILFGESFEGAEVIEAFNQRFGKACTAEQIFLGNKRTFFSCLYDRAGYVFTQRVDGRERRNDCVIVIGIEDVFDCVRTGNGQRRNAVAAHVHFIRQLERVVQIFFLLFQFAGFLLANAFDFKHLFFHGGQTAGHDRQIGGIGTDGEKLAVVRPRDVNFKPV